MINVKNPFWNEVKENGFSIVPSAVTTATISKLVSEIDSVVNGRSGYALRTLAESVPAVRELAGSREIRSLVETIIGANAFLVRSLFFDKTPEANWKVAWHQDLTIAVKKRIDVEGFRPWSIKDDVPHVQPPADVIERMLTVRLHLDDCDWENGPLQLLPGSHKQGKLTAEDIQILRERIQPTTCIVPAGGAVLMRPLILHASSAAHLPRHRRVVHLEFAAEPLPGGLQWLD